MMARCEGNEIEVLERVFLPHSLGSFYTMICEFIGYKKYGDEGKVMGLAPYGKDTYCKADERDYRPEGSAFGSISITSCRSAATRACKSGTTAPCAWQDISPIVWNRAFGKPREPHAEITQRDMDLSYAMQHRFEEVFFHLLSELYRRVPLTDLVMAGGCALNSVANGKLFAKLPFAAPGSNPRPEMKDWRSAPRFTLITRLCCSLASTK